MQIICSDWSSACPSFVNPDWLDAADTQWTCHQPNTYCTVTCSKNDAGELQASWTGHACAAGAQGRCPPYGLTPSHMFDEEWRTQEELRKAERRRQRMNTVTEVVAAFQSEPVRWALTGLPPHHPPPP